MRPGSRKGPGLMRAARSLASVARGMLSLCPPLPRP